MNHKKLFNECIKKRKMYQHRWEIFRKQRELDKAEQSEVERKRMFKTFYLKYIHSFYVFKSIFNMYDIRQKQKILEHRKLYCCNRIKRRVLKLLQRFAPSIEERQINSVRYSLNSVMDFVYEPQLKKSKYILCDFLRAAADKHLIYYK